MARPIRFGVWGTGFIAQQLAADLSLVAGAVLHGAGSRDLGRAKAFAEAYQAGKAYEGLAAMVADHEIDVVYIASPNHRHAPDALLCIEAGRAVLCEKPFAITEVEARSVVEAARARRVFCMEAMWTRFFPAIVDLKRRLGAGQLGKVGLIQGNFAIVADPHGSRFASPEMGGGALLDLGVYFVSLAQHLLGEPCEVSGHANVAASGADVSSTFQLAWKDGTLAAFCVSLSMRGTNEMLMLGERGRLRMPDPFYSPHRLEVTLDEQASEGSSPAGASGSSGFARPRPAYARLLRRRMSPVLDLLRRRGSSKRFDFGGNGYQFQLAEVVRCLNDGQTESPVMPLEDTLAVMRTMDTISRQWKPAER